MANVTTTPGVIGPLDTAADNIVAAGSKVQIKLARFVRPTAAGAVTITDAGGSAIKLELAAGAGFSDVQKFSTRPLILDGLKVIAIAAGGALYLHTEAF